MKNALAGFRRLFTRKYPNGSIQIKKEEKIEKIQKIA